MHKILIPIQGDFVAPRFDCATEIIIAITKDGVLLEPPRTMIMERSTEEDLCQKIIGENISELICGGIDQEHYDFLIWKKLTIIDGVVGGWEAVLAKTINNTIHQGEIVWSKTNDILSL